MKEINEAKKKAIIQVLNKISETGYPTCHQLIFLEMFFNEEKVKEEKE